MGPNRVQGKYFVPFCHQVTNLLKFLRFSVNSNVVLCGFPVHVVNLILTFNSQSRGQDKSIDTPNMDVGALCVKQGTTFQSMMNTKLSLDGFWYCHENGLIQADTPQPICVFQVSFPILRIRINQDKPIHSKGKQLETHI